MPRRRDEADALRDLRERTGAKLPREPGAIEDDAMPQARILVVEDSQTVAMTVQRGLTRRRYQALGVAPSGEEAIRMAEDLKPDLVLMDIRLRGPMDGIDAAARIQEGASIPVVYITGYGDGELLRRARKTGPYGYLMKPLDSEAIHATVEIALARSKVDRALEDSLARFELLAQGTNDGIWDWDILNGESYLSPRLGEAAGASRVYLFRNSTRADGEIVARQTHEWTAPSVSPQIGNPEMQSLPLRASGFQPWIDVLSTGQEVACQVAQCPDGVREILEAQDISWSNNSRRFSTLPR